MSTTAIAAAVSGLRVSQEAFDVLSNNVANVNNEKYLKREISTEANVTDGIGTGTRVASVMARIDKFLVELVRVQESDFASSEVKKEFYDRLSQFIGTPDENNNLNFVLRNFFSKLSGLQNDPTVGSMRSAVVLAGRELANTVREVAEKVQFLRLKADQDLQAYVTQANAILKRMRELNNLGAQFDPGTQGDAAINEEKNTKLNELSALLNITSTTQDTGELLVSTTSGMPLLDKSEYELEYTGMNTSQEFIDDIAIKDLNLYPIASTGARGVAIPLITGGQENNVTTILKSGKFKALHDLRDIEFVKIAERLDNLALEITKSMNAIHNSGAGLQPYTALTGKRELTFNDQSNWSGKVKIGLVDENGDPVMHIHDTLNPNRILRPLEINLSGLDAGNGAGKLLTNQSIIDEINEYFFFAPTLARVQLGEIENIKIVSRQATTAPAGTFSFDFELDNSYDKTYTVDVLSITVNNGSTGLATALPASETISAGTRSRTSNVNTINLDGGGGTYTITALVKITDSDGIAHASSIRFDMTDTEANALNKRFEAKGATGDNTINATKGATFVNPYTTKRFLKADWVDSNGASTATTNPGFLKLTGEKKANSTELYRIAIDDQNSKELGNANITATNFGLSHYFRLNNLYEESGVTRNSAIKMKLNSDIDMNPNLLSVGKLTNLYPGGQDVSMNTPATPAGAYITFSGGNPQAGDTITLNGTVFTFVAGAPAANQIDVSGGTWPTILASTLTQLNASNATTATGGADLATFSAHPTFPNTLQINFKTGGVIGNSYTVSAALTFAATMNGLTPVVNPSGVLSGGTDNVGSRVKRNLYKFGVTKADSESAKSLLALQTIQVSFAATATTPLQSSLIKDYLNGLIDFMASSSRDANTKFSTDSNKKQTFVDKIRSTTGVNIDEEMAKMMKYQSAYAASAKVITAVNRMTESLLAAII